MKQYLARNQKISKMSGVRTFNWGIPAFRAKDGFITCPYAGKCAGGCYARPGQGFYGYPHVQKAYEARLALSKTPEFIDTINRELRSFKVERLRIHDSGDFYSWGYATDWITIVRANPKVHFYAYTKAITVVRILSWPENITFILSEGGQLDHMINRDVDRHSRVFINHQDILDSGYADASSDDSQALGPNHRIGLLYHGASKRKAFTTGEAKV